MVSADPGLYLVRMTTMKAIRVGEYGDANVLHLEDVPRPEPKDDEILVRIVAAGVNPIDWKTRAGFMKGHLPLAFPWVPGLDFSGVVERTGAEVSDLAPGDEVFGKNDLPHDGSYAEYVVVHHRNIAPKPRSISHERAAAVPLAALTAWQALFGTSEAGSLELASGQRLLIRGAAGGVGTFALQFATWKGAHVVAAVRSHDDDERLRSLGAEMIIDTSTEPLDAAGEVDAVLDLVGGEMQSEAWQQLRRGGAFASTMGAPSESEAKSKGARTVAVLTKTNATQLQRIAGLIDEGAVRVDVDKTMPLSSAAEAHRLLERGGVHGKLVLLVAQP